MLKKEIIWREILDRALSHKQFEFTQKAIAQKYGFSLSTVFHALEAPCGSGSIKKKGRGFYVQDAEKLLYLWATFRQIRKDILYETAVGKRAQEIEGEMPPRVIYGVYSAYVKKYQEAPADYDKVYVYASEENLAVVKERFPYKKGYPNLVVLKQDPWLETFGPVTPDAQTFADLWNVQEWYGKDFLEALKTRLFG